MIRLVRLEIRVQAMFSGYLDKLRMLHGDAKLYMGMWATAGICWMGIYAVVFNLYLLRLGYGPDFVGLANGVIFLGLSLFCMVAGWMGRVFGTRRMLVLSMGLSTLGYLAVPFTEMIPDVLREAYILLTYGSIGIFASFRVVNSAPYLMGITGVEERDHAFALTSAIQRLSGFVGSLLGGVLPGIAALFVGVTLESPVPFRLTLFIPPIVSAVGFFLILATRRSEPVQTEQSKYRSGPFPALLVVPLSLVHLLWMAGTWSARTFFNVYMDTVLHAPTALIGAVLATGQLLAVLASMLAPIIMARVGRFKTLLMVFCGLAVSQFVLAVVANRIAAGVDLITLFVLLGLAIPVFKVYGQEIVSPDWQTIMAGFTNTAWAVGTAGLIFTGGQIVTSMGYSRLFLMGTVMPIGAALLFGLYFRLPWGEYLHRGKPPDSNA